MKAIYWKLYIYWLSLRWIFSYNLGDEVVYKGKVFTLNQGVSSPRWDICNATEHHKYVHAKEFTKRKTLQNYIHSYKSGVRFYMTSWYSIWVKEGIKPWMRGCNIWKR